MILRGVGAAGAPEGVPFSRAALDSVRYLLSPGPPGPPPVDRRGARIKIIYDPADIKDKQT